MSAGHYTKRDRRGRNAWENAGIDEMDPLPAGRSAQQIRFETGRIRSHGETAACMKAPAWLGDLQHHRQRDRAELQAVAEQFARDSPDYLPGFRADHRRELQRIVSRFDFSQCRSNPAGVSRMDEPLEEDKSPFELAREKLERPGQRSQSLAHGSAD